MRRVLIEGQKVLRALAEVGKWLNINTCDKDCVSA